MPHRQVPDADIGYHLLLFDEGGSERPERPERRDGDGDANRGLYSETVIGLAGEGDVTDVFLLSHGWQGDIPAAIRQYDRWVAAMARQGNDLEQIRTLVPNFKALTVAVHWPSLPWGVEHVEAALLGPDDDAEVDEFAYELNLEPARLVNLYAPRIADTDVTRSALCTIIRTADDPTLADQIENGQLPLRLRSAYQDLFSEADLALDGVAGAPGFNQVAFDPAGMIAEAQEQEPNPPVEPLLGGLNDLAAKLRRAKNLVLTPVRQLSFWQMKRRARTVGESGVHDLVVALEKAAPGARIHMMGHSFGCIVVSAAIAGPRRDDVFGSRLPRPIGAVFLVQGAMSLWSYADQVPFDERPAGFFRPILEPPSSIKGPLVATRSTFDTAVGTYYPLGARAVGDVVLGDDNFPKFGGIGSFGAQGTKVVDVTVLGAEGQYGMRPGELVNVEASRVISNGSGASGAHSDLDHDEIAHLMWQAVTASVAG